MRGGLLVLATALALAGETGAAAPTDEGTARRIVGTGSCAMPAWAPDGGRLLFHARRKDDKQNPVPLTDDPGTEDQPAWSPDGRQIAYAAFPKEGGSFDIWLVNADGSGRRRLTTTPANELFPAWHPDSVHLVYVTDASGNFDLYQIDVRDGRTTPLVVSPDHEARPAFSPDGTKLAFSRWPAHGRSSDATLWIANADGTAPIELTAAPAPHPAWSPDGRTLAFQHHVATGWEIWSLALPADIARTGHLRLAQQVRGGADVDTAKLRGGDTVRGTVEEASFKVRAAYGELVLPRAAVASILFGTGERGLARVVLANGDTVTGFLEHADIAIAAGGRTQRVAVEQVEQLSLRAAKAPAGDASFRAVMRNGDSLLVSGAFGPLHLKVGDRPTDLDARQVDRVEFAEGGEKATAVLVNGDSLTGQLGGGRLELVLAAGARVAVHPSTIRALVRAAVRPASMAGS